VVLRKDDVVTDQVADHERCGVLDPLDDASASLTGRGTRITIKGATDTILADVIIGKPVQGAQGFRYVRKPLQKRVYISRIEGLAVSTSFQDWIEPNLLHIEPGAIREINIRNYSVDERTGRVQKGETLLLNRSREGGWKLDGPGAQLHLPAVQRLVDGLADLKIIDVVPKTAGVAATLSGAGDTKIGSDDRADLARKGFYLLPDGQLLSNDGEIIVRSDDGIAYTLRFGEVVPNAPAGVPETTNAGKALDVKKGEHRFVFITAAFHRVPASLRSTEAVRKALAELRARFAPWYYILSSESFSTIRPSRADLVTTG
jgi:hypothetical protein